MKNNDLKHKIQRELYNYFLFFSLVAFLVSCTTMLFVSVIANTLEIELSSENMGSAAKLTFLNVIVLSILFFIIDTVRRKLTTEKITKQIADAAKKIVQGDFSVRISMVNHLSADEKFNEIIDCFNKMAEELAGVETLRTDFVANVSHEMKNPLAIIQNYGTLLQAPGLSEKKRMEYAKGGADGSRRLADMMTNILKLNRLEKQQIYPKTEEYDLGEQLCTCLLNYERVWEDKNIEIETDIDDNVMITADEELMMHVWNNLLSNAFKFTSENGTVSVFLKKCAEKVVVTISDTGCGMSEDVICHIFEKFYQGDKSHNAQGNGLGLSIAKKVIEIVGGKIDVESEIGKWSTFTITF